MDTESLLKSLNAHKDIEDLRYLERLQAGAEDHRSGNRPSSQESDQDEQ